MQRPFATVEEIRQRPPRGGESLHPWLTVEIGGEFVVEGKATKYVARRAAHYKTFHGLQFSCRKHEAGTLVRRIA